MTEEELYMMVCKYPCMGRRAIGNWLEMNPISDTFVERFKPFLQDGFLSQLDGIPISYFKEQPDLFIKEEWLKTRMDYHALEDEEFQKQFNITNDEIKLISLHCSPANGDKDICDADMEFIRRNKEKSWMDALVIRMDWEVVINLQIDDVFHFQMSHLYPIMDDYTSSEVEQGKNPAVIDFAFEDLLSSDEPVSIAFLTKYHGVRTDWVETALDKRIKLYNDANCFSLAEIFNRIPEEKYAVCLQWLDDNDIFTKKLFTSLCEDANFDFTVRMKCSDIFNKFGANILDEDGMD